MAFEIVLLACVASVAVAVPQQFRINNGNSFNFDLLTSEINREPETTTPIVPILRSIDRQNPDGSYTYGYESGDGTYKIETRYATGEVKGKYGYYDDTGLFREVEYGAEPEKGFMPEGEGLTFVAPEAPATPSTPVVTAAPVTAAPQRAFAPTPRPVTRSRPILNERIRSTGRRDPAKTFIENRGRRVTVVKRKRPVPQPKPEPVIRPKAHAVPTPAPTVAPVTAAPVQRAQPVFQNFQQPQQQVFQQPQQQFFQPQQRFLPVAQQQQPVQPVSLATAFSAHPFINQFNPSTGIFSYNY